METDDLDNLLSLPISTLHLKLTPRLLRVLKRAGLTTVGLVTREPETVLLSYNDLGKRSVLQIKQKISALGLIPGHTYPLGSRERSVFLEKTTDDNSSSHYIYLLFSCYFTQHECLHIIFEYLLHCDEGKWKNLHKLNLDELITRIQGQLTVRHNPPHQTSVNYSRSRILATFPLILKVLELQ